MLQVLNNTKATINMTVKPSPNVVSAALRVPVRYAEDNAKAPAEKLKSMLYAKNQSRPDACFSVIKEESQSAFSRSSLQYCLFAVR